MSADEVSTRFNSLTGTIARQQQEITKLQQENDFLKENNARLMLENNFLKQRINELEKQDSFNSDENSTGKVIKPILQDYLTATLKNIDREPHGYRYFLVLFF